MMEGKKSNEQLVSGLFVGVSKKEFLDYLTTVTMFYFVEGDWDPEQKHLIYARYLDLCYFIEDVEINAKEEND